MFFSQRAENLAERGGGGQTADFSLCFERTIKRAKIQPLFCCNRVFCNRVCCNPICCDPVCCNPENLAYCDLKLAKREFQTAKVSPFALSLPAKEKMGNNAMDWVPFLACKWVFWKKKQLRKHLILLAIGGFAN